MTSVHALNQSMPNGLDILNSSMKADELAMLDDVSDSFELNEEEEQLR